MAHIETLYICPVCSKKHDTENKAVKCRNQHPILSQRWAIAKTGKYEGE